MFWCDVSWEIITLNNHNAELQRTNPGTKVTDEFSTKGRIFPPNAQNGFLLFPSFQSGKYTKTIGHMPIKIDPKM